MSKLLLDEQPLVIMPKLATVIGLNESIVLQQIHYWLNINKEANKNYHDGYHWTYNSYPEWRKQFPFWSEPTIGRIIRRLENLHLVVSGNYNKLKIDRTKWYRIDYEVLEILETSPLYQNDMIKVSEWNDHLISLKRPLPEITTDTTTKTTKDTMVSPLAKREIPLDHSAYNFSDEDKEEIVKYYTENYKYHLEQPHPRLKPLQWKQVDKGLDGIMNVMTGGDMDSPDADEWKLMIDKHFATKYKNCDYNILHFITDGIKTFRMYETIYGK